jgi:hypothetical protein
MQRRDLVGVKNSKIFTGLSSVANLKTVLIYGIEIQTTTSDMFSFPKAIQRE